MKQNVAVNRTDPATGTRSTAPMSPDEILWETEIASSAPAPDHRAVDRVKQIMCSNGFTAEGLARVVQAYADLPEVGQWAQSPQGQVVLKADLIRSRLANEEAKFPSVAPLVHARAFVHEDEVPHPPAAAVKAFYAVVGGREPKDAALMSLLARALVIDMLGYLRNADLQQQGPSAVAATGVASAASPVAGAQVHGEMRTDNTADDSFWEAMWSDIGHRRDSFAKKMKTFFGFAAEDLATAIVAGNLAGALTRDASGISPDAGGPELLLTRIFGPM